MRKRLILPIVSLSTALAGNAMADVLEGMQGAWVMEGTDCAATFTTVDGQVRFLDRGGSMSTGIIISGDKITGTNVSCTARRLKKDKDRMTVSLSCADAIMFSDVSVSFRMLGDGRFERFDPIFSDVLATYQRCSP